MTRLVAVPLLIALRCVPALLVADDHESQGPQTDDEKVLYAIGMLLSGNLTPLDLSAEEIEMVSAGLRDQLLGRDTHGVDPMAMQAQVQALIQGRAERMAVAEKQAGQEFLAAAAAEEGAVKTESGLVYLERVAGEGASPQATDQVKVHYEGTLRDGTIFDSSRQRGEPVTFGLGQVIPCWTEGVAKMKVGGTSRLVCPSDIAYGDAGRPPTIKPGAVLAFEVELLEIVTE